MLENIIIREIPIIVAKIQNNFEKSKFICIILLKNNFLQQCMP